MLFIIVDATIISCFGSKSRTSLYWQIPSLYLLGRMSRTKYYLPADGAPSHTGRPMFTIGTTLPEISSEILKNRAVPRLLDGVGLQVHGPSPSLVVKTAREHRHIRGDVGRPAGALTGIDAGQVDIH